MKMEQLQRALTIAFFERKSLELVGWFGIGKTEGVHEFVRNLTNSNFKVRAADGSWLVHKKGEPVGLEVCLIPTYAVEDIRGFPMPDYDNEEMFYSLPPFFPSERKYPDGIPRFGVILLDECRLGPDEVVKAITQFFLERKIGDHSLDQYGHWVVFAASNREEDRVGIGKEPPIITQRKMVINLEPTIGAFTKWLEAHEEERGVPPIFRFFAQENPSVVLSLKTPDTGEPFCTPRTLVEAGQLCNRYMQMIKFQGKNKYDIPWDDDFLVEIMGSKIGTGAAAQLQQYSRMVGHVPAYTDIIKNPDKAVLPTFERVDAQYVTITVIEHQAGDWSREKDGTYDYEKLDKEVDSLVRYLMRLPPEFQVVGLTRTFKKCPEIYSHPLVARIAKENPTVLKALK